MKLRPDNYARNLDTGEIIPFRGSAFLPNDPSRWAVYKLPPTLPAQRFRVIGEDDDIYRLRQLTRRPDAVGKRAAALFQMWGLIGLDDEDRKQVEALEAGIVP